MDRSPTALLTHTTVWAVAIYTVDAWVLGFGVFGALIGSIVALVAIGSAVNAFGRGQRPHGYAHLGRMAIWAFTAVISIGTVRFQASRAKAHADTVVAACQAYKAANGDYPERLSELVPAYLPSVPRAKYTLLEGQFRYFHAKPDRTTLTFTVIAPFMRTTYDFERDSLFTLD